MVSSRDSCPALAPAFVLQPGPIGELRMKMAYLLTVLWKTVIKARRDHIGLIAAGVAFFVVLATFPAIATVVSIYSIFADPSGGAPFLAALPSVLPEQAIQFISRQARLIAERQVGSAHSLGPTAFVGLAILLWSANRGMRSFLVALTVIHEESDSRGFVKQAAIAFLFTAGFIAFSLFVIGTVFFLPAMLQGMGLEAFSALIVTWLRWPVLLAVVTLSLTLIYRFGSAGYGRSWRGSLPGSIVASLLWLLLSVLFEWSVSNFASFDQLSGSLNAAIGFVIWVWLSTLVALFGA